MFTSKYLMIASIIGFVLLQSCNFDTLPEASPSGCESGTITYDNTIQAILETNCAYTGCHLSGFPYGDLSSYTDDLIDLLQNGDFKEQTIDLREMPPEYAFGPTTLSEEDLQVLKCWVEDGYPK